MRLAAVYCRGVSVITGANDVPCGSDHGRSWRRQRSSPSIAGPPAAAALAQPACRRYLLPCDNESEARRGAVVAAATHNTLYGTRPPQDTFTGPQVRDANDVTTQLLPPPPRARQLAVACP